MFITFEGIDGAGKSTQAKILYNRMKKEGTKVYLTKEPTEGRIGALIKSIISNSKIKYDIRTLQLLFVTDRSDHVNRYIEPKLKKGYTVISDRYFFSTITYGAAFGLDPAWLYNLNSKFPYPDHIFVIDTEPKEGIKRLNKRGHKDYFEKELLLQKIRKEYKVLTRKYPNCHIIDGNKTMKDVSKSIFKILKL
ncbi:MAG: dTMP kinase [Nitrososphaeria archaeon]